MDAPYPRRRLEQSFGGTPVGAGVRVDDSETAFQLARAAAEHGGTHSGGDWVIVKLHESQQPSAVLEGLRSKGECGWTSIMASGVRLRSKLFEGGPLQGPPTLLRFRGPYRERERADRERQRWRQQPERDRLDECNACTNY